jgi:hypothetical protein
MWRHWRSLRASNLPRNQFNKLFSPAEANELIPTLELVVRDLQESAKSLRDHILELSRTDTDASASSLAELIKRYPELRAPAGAMAEAVQKIEALGGFLKDIDMGLIDLPCEFSKDQVVFLCWQSGEPAITAWHPIDAGFAQRQALPGANRPYLN